ncbi:MAG: hypothetical protein AAFW69_05395 [Pseudomonadota bacterium]
MLRTVLILALAGLSANVAFANPIAVRPAAQQPTSATPGLAVRYAYPGDVRSLAQAERERNQAEPGPPLQGFDYPDTFRGQPALTSERSTRVVAFFEGYMLFDQVGVHRLQFHNNDGLRVAIGGETVYVYDGRHPCESNGWVEIDVPEVGWYPVSGTFFQRMETSCLMLRMEEPDGTRRWTDVSITRH